MAVGHIPFFRFYFGKHRDLFVALTIMIVCGLMFPTAITEAFYSMNDTILFISLVIIGTACLLHFVHFFLTATRTCTVCSAESFSYRIEDIRYDPISFLVASGLFIGDFIFLISNIDDDCSSYGTGSDLVLQCESWWDNFTATIILYFMIAYLIPLIFANRVERDIQAKFWFSSNRFRIYYLCAVLTLNGGYLGFSLWYYWKEYNDAYRVWLYCSISLAAASVAIALMVMKIIDRFDIDPNAPPGKQYGWIVIWFVISSGIAVFGCYIYWHDMKTSHSDGLYRCGEMVMFSQWTVWIIAEAFVPINVPQIEEIGAYQQLSHDV